MSHIASPKRSSGSTPSRWLPLIAALVIFIAACGGSTPTATVSPGVTPSPENALTVAGPAGGIGDVFQSLLKTWGATNGVTITYITGTSSSSFAKIQAQAQAGQMQIDILNGNDQISALGRAQGIWAPINLNLLTNKGDLNSSLAFPKDVVGDPPVATRIFVIPSGIAYNSDVFAKNGWPAPTSWLDLVNPMYGKCLAPLDPNQGVPWIPMLNKITTGDWNNATTTFAMLKVVAPSIQSWNNTNPSALALVAKGTSCMTPTSQGRYISSAAGNPSLKYVTPKEGMVVFGGTLNITKMAPHPIAAQMALNMLLGLDAGNELLDAGYFPSVNTRVNAPLTGPASAVPTVAQIEQMSPQQVPISTYDHLDDWLHQYQTIASGS